MNSSQFARSTPRSTNLGQRTELSGLVGWANQLHRLVGNDGPKVQLPSLGHVIAPSAYPDAPIPVGVGNLWMELTAVWIVVLLASGIYLWWPRAIQAAKPLLTIRWNSGGRVRWRDLRALTGVVVAIIVIGHIISGTTWSRCWGENWRAFSSTVAPSAEIDASSTPAKMGDYDRLGRRIAWAATDDPVYASAPDGPGPQRLSFADIDRIVKGEYMVPGYAIIAPSVRPRRGRRNARRQLYGRQRVAAETIRAAHALPQPVHRSDNHQRTAAQDGALSRLTWATNSGC